MAGLSILKQAPTGCNFNLLQVHPDKFPDTDPDAKVRTLCLNHLIVSSCIVSPFFRKEVTADRTAHDSNDLFALVAWTSCFRLAVSVEI